MLSLLFLDPHASFMRHALRQAYADIVFSEALGTVPSSAFKHSALKYEQS